MSERCPAAQDLAAYVEGTLPPDEADALTRHLARCGECAGVLAGGLLFAAEARQHHEPPRQRRLVPAALAAFAAVVAAGVGIGIGIGWNGADESPRHGLTAVAASRRPVLPRLTGGFRWAAPPEPTRGIGAGAGVDPAVWDYLAAADRARLQAASDGAPGPLGDLGVGHLLLGNSDAAVEALARAVAAAPGDARLLSDLGGARLARGLRADDAGDLATALETIDRALAREPRLPEALFNRALALAALHLPHTATRAWDAYLAVDAESPWAAEARQRRQTVESPEPPPAAAVTAELLAAAEGDGGEPLAGLVRRYRHQAQRLVQERLLPRAGAATAAGDEAGAARNLALAGALGREWERQTGDSSLRAAVDELAGASGPGRQRLAVAHRELGAAIAHHDAMQTAAARAAAERACAGFAAATSPLEAWAWLARLRIAAYGSEGEQAAAFAALERLAAEHPLDPATRARVAWAEGLIRSRRGELAAAIPAYAEALALLERLGDAEAESWMRSLLAEAHSYAGDGRAAWRYRALSLAAATRLPDRDRALLIRLTAAVSALVEERPHVALALLDEIAAEPPSGPAWQPAEIHLWRARAQLAVGRAGEAAAEAARAVAWAELADDPAVRRRLGAELAVVRGMAASDPAAAVAALSAAIAGLRDTGIALRLPETLARRAEAYLALGRLDEAERDLAVALARLAPPAVEATPAEQLWGTSPLAAARIHDAMVALQLRRGRPALAFAYAELARARGQAAAAGGAARAPAAASPAPAASGLAELEERLDPGTTVLAYALLPDRAVAWRVRRGATALVALPASPERLAHLSATLTADLAAGAWSPATRAAAQELYRALVAPARLDSDTRRLVVLPDGELHRVPFAALVDPTSGRFLVEERELVTAVSAAQYLQAAARSTPRRAPDGPPPSVLVLGADQADPVLFPDLPRLHAVAAEAREVAALYPAAELRVGGTATRAALDTPAGAPQVVHFAGHAVANPRLPSRAGLALARGPRAEPGVLFAADVPRLSLAGTRVVVLAACATAAGVAGDDGAPLSLARAFLAADVPAVVATLWPVADGRTAALSLALHRRLSRGEDAATALRAAQRELLGSDDPELRSPAAWAAFQALGG